jgi:hypothetical protein
MRHNYATRGQKVIDFIIGFIGWFFFNGLAWGAIQLVSALLSGGLIETFPGDAPPVTTTLSDLASILFLALSCAILLANIVSVIVFARTRYWIALGEVSAFAASLILVLCAGATLAAICFTALGSGQGL